MNEEFPSAVPEIRVKNVARAAVYYEKCLGFPGLGCRRAWPSLQRCRIFD
jgi:hypothetical protein